MTLPTVGGSEDAWGTLMNAHINIEHATDGTHDQTKVGRIDRGDPASVDFAKTDLTDDSEWNDLDLSSIINNVRAKAVTIGVNVIDNVVGSNVKFRKNGNSQVINVGAANIYNTSVTTSEHFTIACDASQVIELNATPKPTDWTAINITVLAWWL